MTAHTLQRSVSPLQPVPKAVQGNENVTVVTAYFDIGAFPKGSYVTKFSNNTYTTWAGRYHFIMNPVILYTDSQKFADYFNTIRKGLRDRTRVILIDRNTSWAFQRRDKIAAIFQNPKYPKHLPNTVVPEYACAQFAKYDVISRAAQEHTFETKYYMWLDIGYFRERSGSKYFFLEKPKDFEDTKIAMNLVYFNRQMSTSPERIFKQNIVWVGGGVIFGEKSVVIRYEQQFKNAVDYFISVGLMNTDQQVTFSMFSDEGKRILKPEIELQVYKPPSQYNWFYLGFSMIREVSR